MAAKLILREDDEIVVVLPTFVHRDDSLLADREVLGVLPASRGRQRATVAYSRMIV